MAKDANGPPTDPGEFAEAVVRLYDYLLGARTLPFKGNDAQEVRQVAFGLNLIREMLDCWVKGRDSELMQRSGVREAYAILDHLTTGRRHPISVHIRGIHSGRYRPSRAPVNAIEHEAQRVVVGVCRAYARSANISANAARTKVVAASRKIGIHFTKDMIKKWDDRFKRPDGVEETDAKADFRSEAYAHGLLSETDRDPERVLGLGLTWISKWCAVPRLPDTRASELPA
jgi:hypothetical protein